MSKEFFVLSKGIKSDGTYYVNQRFFTAPLYDINDPIVYNSIDSIVKPYDKLKDVVSVNVLIFELTDWIENYEHK